MEETDIHTSEPQPRCEYGRTHPSEGECQRIGENLQSDGSLLCASHAKVVRLEAREGTMLGTVFEMDAWLANPNNQADDLYWRRVRRERDETVEQLRFNRTLIEANKEANRRR